MKKGFIAILAVLLFASVASANMTRIATMGWNDALLWDEENIFWCPALAGGYPSEILVELGTYRPKDSLANASVAVFLTNDEMASMGVLGIVVNRTTASVPNGDLEFMAPIPSFDLIYAKNMGGFGVGGMLTFARNSSTTEQAGDSTDKSTMVIGFTPGVTFAMGEKGSVDLGFGFQMISFSVEDKRSGETWENDGATAMGGNLRAMLPMGEYVFFIPYVGFQMSSLNWKYTSADPSPDTTYSVTDSDSTMFGGGFGLNIMPFEETTVIVGFEVGVSSWDNSSPAFSDSINSYSTMTPAFVFGAESRFNSWMTGRIGARKTFFSSYSDEGYAGDKSSSATDAFQMALGLGMVFGDFTIDAMLDENFLFEGPNFIGGFTTAPNARLTATYNFSGM